MRPDIAFAVHRASRHAHAPRKCDWRWTKSIVHYLKGTNELKLKLKGMVTDDEPPTIILESHNDAAYAANRTDQKSASGGIIFLNEMIVRWICQKQVIVTQSTIEAEFVEASLVAIDFLGLKELLGEIGLRVANLMMMHVDVQDAIRQIQGEYSAGRE